MILGMGLDVVDVDAFRTQLEDRASSFVEGSFSPYELEDASSRPSRDWTRHLAVRYAAKEAFIKAWSLAIFGQPPALAAVDMREIELQSDPWHRPQLVLHGAVAQAIEALGPLRIHLSVSHDGAVAAAVVLLEQRT